MACPKEWEDSPEGENDQDDCSEWDSNSSEDEVESKKDKKTW